MHLLDVLQHLNLIDDTSQRSIKGGQMDELVQVADYLMPIIAAGAHKEAEAIAERVGKAGISGLFATFTRLISKVRGARAEQGLPDPADQHELAGTLSSIASSDPQARRDIDTLSSAITITYRAGRDVNATTNTLYNPTLGDNANLGIQIRKG